MNLFKIILLFSFIFCFKINAQNTEDSITSYLTNFSSDSLELNDVRKFGFPVSDGNSVKLLMSGHEKFEDLFEHINKAEKFIHMEYFNFRNDSINSLLINLLHEKAMQGVEIRILYDAFGNSSNNKPIYKEKHDSIASLGIQIYKFDPIKFPWVNHLTRDHRKIVVIDGIWAYTGGMNVADYYIDGLEGIGEWRDMHMRIQGPAVNHIHQIFVDMWAKQTGLLLTGAKYFPVFTNIGNTKIAIVNRQPRTNNQAIRQLYISMLNNAKKTVKIINPYFVPTYKIRKAIENALKRGVDVQIIVSEKGDIPLTPEASQFTAYKLMKKGAKVYFYQKGFHHAKIMMVDNSFCTIGSANLNSRSIRYDLEINTIVFDKIITKQLVDMFEQDKKDSYMLDLETWKKRNKWKKNVGWFGSLLTPFL
mgnify:CR=1 FL=1